MQNRQKPLDPHAHIKQKKFQLLSQKVPGTVITVSDRCANGQSEDRSGPLAQTLLKEYKIECSLTVVADGIESVQNAIKDAIKQGARVVFTTGGTGVTPRDLTPEATAPLLSVQLPALSQQIINYGLQNTPLAGLSRALVGITERGTNGVLIINAPGSRGGVKDTIKVVGPLIPHILEQFDPDTFTLIKEPIEQPK